MLQPIVGLLAGRIIANDIGGPLLAEMNTNSRNLAPDQFGQLTGGQWPPGLQVQHELIHNGISEQPTQTRFPITLFFHRGRSTTTSALLSNTLRRFDNSQNIKMMPSSNTSTFLELRKRGNDSSTLFRTALLVPSPESRSCASSTLAVS